MNDISADLAKAVERARHKQTLVALLQMVEPSERRRLLLELLGEIESLVQSPNGAPPQRLTTTAPSAGPRRSGRKARRVPAKRKKAVRVTSATESEADSRTQRLLTALAEKRGAPIPDLSAVVYDGDTSPKAQSNLRSLLAAQKRVKRVRAYARGKWEVIAE